MVPLARILAKIARYLSTFRFEDFSEPELVGSGVWKRYDSSALLSSRAHRDFYFAGDAFADNRDRPNVAWLRISSEIAKISVHSLA